MASEIDAASYEVIDSKDIMNIIMKGRPVDLDRKIIYGDISIEDCLIPSSILITNSIFKGYIYLPSNFFCDILCFTGTIFEKHVNLYRSWFNEKIFFDKAQFKGGVSFNNNNIRGNAYFNEAFFYEYVDFEVSRFKRETKFIGAKFLGRQYFDGAKFMERVIFDNSSFKESANFRGANFDGWQSGVYFKEVQFQDGVDFGFAKFKNKAIFKKSRFEGNVIFDGARFYCSIDFSGTQFTGKDLRFERTIFDDLASQEEAYRIAKTTLENAGNRSKADDFFELEMKTKRMQKEVRLEKVLNSRLSKLPAAICRVFRYNFLEGFFLGWVFGYGVHPLRLVLFWMAFVSLFAIIFKWENAIIGSAHSWDYAFFSITNAATPGYGNYCIKSDLIVLLSAGVEAIFGTFMWAAFIATFVRKFMR